MGTVFSKLCPMLPPRLSIGFVLLFVFGTYFLSAQSDRKALGIAAISLAQGEWEVILNNMLSLDARLMNNEFRPYGLTETTYSSFVSLAQVTYGVDRAKNFNVGLDAGFNQVFGKDSTYLTSVLAGPRLRWRPFGEFDRTFDITLQNYLRFQFTPMSDTSATASSGSGLRAFWGNDLILTKYLSSDALRAHYLFIAQFGFYLNPKSDNEALDRKSPIATPITLIAGLFPQRNLFFFLGINAQPEFGTVPWDDADTYYRRKASLNGLGGFQISFNNNLFLFGTYSRAILKEGEVFEQSASIGFRLTMGDYGYF